MFLDILYPHQITYLDIYEAIEDKQIIEFKDSNVGKLFEDQERIQKGKQQLIQTMSQVEQAFKDEMKKH